MHRLILIQLLSLIPHAALADPVWRNCSLDKIVDGDTVVLRCAQWDAPQRVRIVGYNTPERCQEGYEAATKWLETTLSEPQNLVLEQLARDTYGRVLGRLYHFVEPNKMVQVIAPKEHQAKRVKCNLSE
jgi:endonuclease YncB( thermonuclease family)